MKLTPALPGSTNEIRNTSDESRIELRGKKSVGLAGGYFDTLVYIGILKREYVIGCDADTTHFYKLDTAVTEQNVLATAVVIGTVES